MQDPIVVKILQEKGEVSDELDYALMNYLIQNRGPGFTACQPSLVELEEGRKAIKVNVDKTFVDTDNRLMGLGIVGKILIDFDTLKVVYCTSVGDLENNVKVLNSAGIDPQPRPRGKY